MTNVFVTGNCGYIGSHFTRSYRTYPGGCDLKSGTDFGNLHGMHIDTLVHLAAYVSVTDSVAKPDEYLDNNCFKILKFLRNNYIRRIIFASTAAVYGNARFAKESDASWKNCSSPYSQSKYAAEQIVRNLYPNHVILRFANVYGGDGSCRGEAAVHSHFASDDPIIVFGGNQTRDFVHINEVATAIGRAVDGKMTGTYNIGTGTEMSIFALAQEFSRTRGGILIESRLPRQGEISSSSLDITQAKSVGLL